MKEVNAYTGLLFIAGIYAFFHMIVQFPPVDWLQFLLVLGLVVLFDLCPVKLPNGIEYRASIIGFLLMLFNFGVSACIASFMISALLLSWKIYESVRKINWFRYFVTIGMYFVCTLFSLAMMKSAEHWPSFLQVLFTAAAFEIANQLLLVAIRRTVIGGYDFNKVILKLFVLLVPTLISTLVIVQFLYAGSLQKWVFEVLYTAVFSIIIIYFSTEFTKEIETRKQTEEALRAAQQDLQDTLKYQQGMTFKFKRVNGRFIHTMSDGELLYKLGFAPDDVIGKELKEFLPKDMAARQEEYYWRAWQGEENVIYEGENNGITYVTSLRPIKRDGQVVEVIASCVDITELKKAEELLRKSDKLAVAGQLAAGIAHEIRNPLTSLRGFVQLLQKGVNKEAYTDVMLSEIDRMDSIIREFLILAKPHATSFKLTNMTALLEQTVTLFNSQAIMKNVQIRSLLEPDIPLVMCDANQLKQVFINILQNAIDSMPNGGVIQIVAKAEPPDQILIRFVDSGIGIPQERLEKLGEPFYSTKEKGTGLGLMISYKIIEEHNGKIKIESEVCKGTVVEIVIPIGHPPASAGQR
ncbi:ATP-binding protein [Effusibacillus pohliae]|uniref:ATP-binding protein n=1 Tax=Effusibacillus pohliae TaxID=232270 RepID=UPI000362FA85|nr:ATP-binding protein [Effusibacillus pohliae]